MANLIVTGGAGFIGANFVHYRSKVAPEDKIIVLDLLTYAGNKHNLDGLDDVLLVEGDICGNDQDNDDPLRRRADRDCRRDAAGALRH